MNEITACCANYYSAKYIRLSQYLLKKLSSDQSRIHWLIIDNTPDDSEKAVLMNAPDTIVVPSLVRDTFSHDKVDSRFSEYSTQHGKALNELVSRIQTRYGLIIDPDCFVMMPNWDLALLQALLKHNAFAIGTPYHPSRRFKYGLDFPMVTFLLFDAKYVLPLNIDFSPGFYPRFENFIYKNRVLKRLKHGTWKDTGWRMRALFNKRHYRGICFDAPMLKRNSPRTGFQKLVAHIVPERLLDAPLHPYVRPDTGFITEQEVNEALGGELYEEHYFEEKLMLIHLRAVSQRKLPFEEQEAQFWIQRIFKHLKLDYESFERSLVVKS